MPCDTQIPVGMTVQERQREIQSAIARLETLLAGGQVSVKIGANGALAFSNWKEADRRKVSDVCAYRKLAVAGSFALRQAVARAELQAGRKLDQRVVAAGVHSHDGGKTWSPGH